MRNLTFKQYLVLNKKRTKRRVHGIGGWGVGYYGGYNNPQNTLSGGDVTGGSFLGGESEEQIPNLKHPSLPADDMPKKKIKIDDENLDDENLDDDPNKQGSIRYVKGAHLVYKRETAEGSFEELWIYNIGNPSRDEFQIRKDILAGTDIPLEKNSSEDGLQSCVLWTVGDAQLLKIEGLPN